MGKNKEKNTGEILKNRMDKVENNESGERSDVEEDKGRNKSNRSSRINSSDPDSGESEFILENLSEDVKNVGGGDNCVEGQPRTNRSPQKQSFSSKTDNSKAQGKGEFSSAGSQAGLGKMGVGMGRRPSSTNQAK